MPVSLTSAFRRGAPPGGHQLPEVRRRRPAGLSYRTGAALECPRSEHHGGMDLRGRDWIGQLPAELAGQRAILEGLLGLCEDSESIRWLVIGCSLARGAADRLSDLDVAMGVRDEEFPVITPGVRRAVGRLGDLVDSYHHRLPGVPGTH